MKNSSNRRSVIKNIITGSVAVASTPLIPTLASCATVSTSMKGNINHSVCRWCFDGLSLDELCIEAKKLGITGIDLVGPKDWPILKKHGLMSTMCNGAEISLVKGWNDPQYHDTLIKNYTQHINLVADAGYKNLICFSGNRNGMDDATGLKNAAEGLKKIMPLAEKRGVVIVMELFNSKVDHKDYMCDNTTWGVDLCKAIGSENFKLLYDIYHMQINEGDVIRTLTKHAPYIAHYHTAGVPGRHEIDETQELYYPAIMKAIVATGYKGYVAQEFIPIAKEKLGSLKKAIEICDI